jgi:hypothetical protein
LSYYDFAKLISRQGQTNKTNGGQSSSIYPNHRILIENPLAGKASRKNEGKSAANFCHQVATLVSDMFCNFYLAKYHKIANNSATTEAREKISTYSKSLEF